VGQDENRRTTEPAALIARRDRRCSLPLMWKSAVSRAERKRITKESRDDQ
jgi:hypothetical protein